MVWICGRPGKFAHAAHFTLRCGRALPGGGWQRPAVALVANLPSAPRALLSMEQAETLWHEMGHALHSLLSRTHFQHLSGALPLHVGCYSLRCSNAWQAAKPASLSIYPSLHHQAT